jgi:hypothetical protein
MRTRPEDIEKLLNGYIDGELTTRQHTEVKRLIANDSKLAQRLARLERCKMLIGSLPQAEAPAGMFDDIKASLARRTLLGEQAVAVGERAGARDLFVRKVLSAAAMIAMVAALSAVIYTIVAPETAPTRPTVANLQPTVPEPHRTVLAAAPFNGRLELKAAAYIEMYASINRAIEENGFVDCLSRQRDDNGTTYVLSCGRKGLNQLLAQLDKNWQKLDSAALFVQTDVFGEPVAVDAVTPEQVAQIVSRNTLEESIRLAKDFALLNDVAEQMRSKALFADDKGPDLMAVPKPRLTGPLPAETTRGPAADKANVSLVIVLTRTD